MKPSDAIMERTCGPEDPVISMAVCSGFFRKERREKKK
jgi:hypothetical protein